MSTLYTTVCDNVKEKQEAEEKEDHDNTEGDEDDDEKQAEGILRSATHRKWEREYQRTESIKVRWWGAKYALMELLLLTTDNFYIGVRDWKHTAYSKLLVARKCIILDWNKFISAVTYSILYGYFYIIIRNFV